MTTSYQADRTTAPRGAIDRAAVDYVWAALRIALGWVFLWAFLDKTFGLGFATEREAAWIEGGSPTSGYFEFGTKGPFADFYQGMAGSAFADALFMVGLGAIGTALILGIGMRIAAASGALLLVLMWTAALPPENNPFMDDHLVYAALLIGLAMARAGDTLGLGRIWGRLGLVERHRWLK
ncbi:DoxX family membrane protein [Glycomyces sp. YM15]|uniref:DoxX family membrane protein n=1 Tax=Glycomyces sp. YM15 TaxID=2800446 RepID=UPI001964FF41|nr:DoxX family membrane protein [Glycomyces sp. YM15]